MDYREELKTVIQKTPHQYVDVRLDDHHSMAIDFSGSELKKVGKSFLRGGHSRVVDGGLMGTNSFTKPHSVEESIARSATVSRALRKTKELSGELASAPIETGEYYYQLDEDPRNISVDEKIELVRHYNKIAADHPKVVTTSLNYEEHIAYRTFVNSEGTAVFQEHVYAKLGGNIFARDGSIVQNVSFNFGAGAEFSRIRNREAEVENAVKVAVGLLDAEPVKGGQYRVILDPKVTGVFIHEAFGHLSESDAIINNQKLREEMQLGRQLGSKVLNVTDQGNFPLAAGFYAWDSEGVASRRTELVKEGVLCGRLHSRASAAAFGEEITGNMRAVDYRYNPIVRMSNIFIENGETSFDDLVAQCEDGLYLIGAKGGQSIGDLFSFGAQYGYKIEKGKITGLVRDINMSGNLFTTMKAILAVGNDFRLNESAGCGKGSVGPMQMMWASGHGGPHTLLEDIVIGGV